MNCTNPLVLKRWMPNRASPKYYVRFYQWQRTFGRWDYGGFLWGRNLLTAVDALERRLVHAGHWWSGGGIYQSSLSCSADCTKFFMEADQSRFTCGGPDSTSQNNNKVHSLVIMRICRSESSACLPGPMRPGEARTKARQTHARLPACILYDAAA